MWKPVVSFVVSQDMATTRHPTVSASPSAASTNTSRSCSSWCCPSSGNRRPRQFSSQPLLEKGDLHDFLFFMFFLGVRRSQHFTRLHSMMLHWFLLIFIVPVIATAMNSRGSARWRAATSKWFAGRWCWSCRMSPVSSRYLDGDCWWGLGKACGTWLCVCFFLGKGTQVIASY